MKISLFYKPSIIKVCSFALITSFAFGTPSSVSANTFTDVADWLLGKDASASTSIIETSSTTPNSSIMDLSISESSINPDKKNIDESENMIIVQEDSLIYSDGLYIPDAKFEKSSLSDQISVYTVESGDTISEIAELFNVSVNTIRWENNISGQTISVGQKLNILPVTGVKHVVKSGDTLSKIADKYDAELEDVSVFNGILKGDSLKQGDIIFIPNGIIKPVVVKPTKPSGSNNTVISNTKVQSGYYLRPTSGIVTSPYGPRRGGFHPGVDIGNVRGTPIVASANGIVTKIITGCVEGKKSCGGRYGNFIEIDHPNGTSTRYAHLSKVSVSLGQTVSIGSQIATMGNTGTSTGSHLHFEIVNSNGSRMRPSF
jgi:LysM repeat protein